MLKHISQSSAQRIFEQSDSAGNEFFLKCPGADSIVISLRGTNFPGGRTTPAKRERLQPGRDRQPTQRNCPTNCLNSVVHFYLSFNCAPNDKAAPSSLSLSVQVLILQMEFNMHACACKPGAALLHVCLCHTPGRAPPESVRRGGI